MKTICGIREQPAPLLTSIQREALEWLKAKRDAYPDTRWGFNPPTGRKAVTAAMRRSLSSRGLVHVERMSDSHFRYDITDAGRDALSSSHLADASPKSNSHEGTSR